MAARRWGLLLVLLGATSFSVPVWADAQHEARRYFEEGMARIDLGRHAVGVASLERAYEILPHPAVLYNIARAWRDAGQWQKSLAAFERYLATDPKDAEEVEAAISGLRRRMAAAKSAAGTPPQLPAPAGATPAGAIPALPLEPGRKTPSPHDDLYRAEVVTASRRAESPLNSPSSTAVVTRQDIRLSGITRIPELLRRVAGTDVMQITGGDTNVSMRGLNSRFSNKVLVLVNGRPVKNDVLGSTFWETLSIDVDQIERIEVVRGPGSSLYGADAFAGVVNIITIAPGDGDIGMRLGFGDKAQAYGSVWASERHGNFAYRASAGYTRYPRWTREVAPGRQDVHLADIDQNLAAQNVRLDIRASQRLGKHRSLEFGGGFSRADLELYGVGPFNDFYSRFDTADVSAAFKSDWLAIRSSYSLLSAFSSQNHDYLGHTLYEGRPLQHSLDSAFEFAKSAQFPSGAEHALLGGFGYRLKSIDWNFLIDSPPVEHHVGLFAQDAISFADHYSVVLSGRFDYVPALQRVMPSGRAAFIVRPGETKRQALRASIATAFRAPTFFESYLEVPIQLSSAGFDLESASQRREDPDFLLQAENVVAAEIGYRNEQTEVFQLDASVFYHRVSDLIALAEPRLRTLSNLADGLGGINQETGRFLAGFGGWTNQCAVDHVFGGEVGAHFYGIDGLDVFANYALHQARTELPEGCVDTTDKRTSHHKVNVGTQLRTEFGLEGEVTFHYQSGQLWREQIMTTDGLAARSFPLPDYHLLNGRIGYRFLKAPHITVAVSVFNALSGLVAEDPQMHPLGNRVGRRLMGFFSYRM